MIGGEAQEDFFIGERAQELRGLLKIKYPIEHGIVNDWDDMEKIWTHVLGKELKAQSGMVLFFRNFKKF